MTKSQNASNENVPAGAGDPVVDDALLAKLDEGFPPSWQPETEGDTIKGAFLRLEAGRTTFGDAPIVILGTDDGERSVWLFAESIRSGFLRAQPAPGELVAIRYEGEVPAKNPTPGKKTTYKLFRVVVDRPAIASAPVDWSAALTTTAVDAGDVDEPTA